MISIREMTSPPQSPPLPDISEKEIELDYRLHVLKVRYRVGIPPLDSLSVEDKRGLCSKSIDAIRRKELSAWFVTMKHVLTIIAPTTPLGDIDVEGMSIGELEDKKTEIITRYNLAVYNPL